MSSRPMPPRCSLRSWYITASSALTLFKKKQQNKTKKALNGPPALRTSFRFFRVSFPSRLFCVVVVVHKKALELSTHCSSLHLVQNLTFRSMSLFTAQPNQRCWRIQRNRIAAFRACSSCFEYVSCVRSIVRTRFRCSVLNAIISRRRWRARHSRPWRSSSSRSHRSAPHRIYSLDRRRRRRISFVS